MFKWKLGEGVYHAADTGAGGGSASAVSVAGIAPQSAEPGQVPGAGAEAEPGPVPGDGAAEWTLERAIAEIKALRKENAGHRKAKSEAERAAQAAEEKRLTEEKQFAELAEKRARERDEALLKLEALQRSLWRQKAAQAAGLPPELAERLQGEDEAAMLVDAKRLAALLPQKVGPGALPGPQRGPSNATAEEQLEQAKRAKRRQYGSL
jgi:hypothetical protein